MAFDIYVGPASRYQSGDWKTVGQQAAEANGLHFVRVGPKKGILSRFLTPKPEKLYARWLEQIKTGHALAGWTEDAWDDSPEQDYVTDRPGWEGHASFLAQYALARNPEVSPPTKAITVDELVSGPAYQADRKDGRTPIAQILACQFFLPGKFQYAFEITNFIGISTGATSVDVLASAVDAVCAHCGYDRAKIGQLDLDQAGSDATFEDAALYGTSIYARHVDEAIARKLPLILDY